MYYAMLVVLILLLLAGGVLAYQNSKLVSKTNQGKGTGRGSSMQYSVYNLSISNEMDEYTVVPLFLLYVSPEASDPAGMSSRRTQLLLCKVNEGSGEMTLSDAQSWMLNQIRETISLGIPIQHTPYLDRAVDDGERELIMSLVRAVKEES